MCGQSPGEESSLYWIGNIVRDFCHHRDLDSGLAYCILGCSGGIFVLIFERIHVPLDFDKSVFWCGDVRVLCDGEDYSKHAKYGVMAMITLMTLFSTTFVWYISTLGNGEMMDPSTWDGADPGYGAVTIIVAGMIGVWWLYAKVKTRE